MYVRDVIMYSRARIFRDRIYNKVARKKDLIYVLLQIF